MAELECWRKIAKQLANKHKREYKIYQNADKSYSVLCPELWPARPEQVEIETVKPV